MAARAAAHLAGLADDAVRAESVSMAMLVVLETLSPQERAVFVLRAVFGWRTEIAEALGTAAAVRQIAHRARSASVPPTGFDPVPRGRRSAKGSRARHRRSAGPARSVAPDVVVLTDGGGKVALPGGRCRAPTTRPIPGRGRAGRGRRHRIDCRSTAGRAGRAWDGCRTRGMQVVIEDGIAQVMILVNPDKLGGLEEPRAIAR